MSYNSFASSLLLRLGFPLLQICLTLTPETCGVPLFKGRIYKNDWAEVLERRKLTLIIGICCLHSHKSLHRRKAGIFHLPQTEMRKTSWLWRQLEEYFGGQARKVNSQQKQHWQWVSFLVDFQKSTARKLILDFQTSESEKKEKKLVTQFMIIFRKAIRNNKLYKMDTIVTFGPLNYWFLVSKIKLAVAIIIIKKRKWWLNKVLNLSMLRDFLLNTGEYIVYFTPRCRFKKSALIPAQTWCVTERWFLKQQSLSLCDILWQDWHVFLPELFNF